MSRALSLVRFPDRSVYHACYDGTSDTLHPWLISERKLRNQFNESIFTFDSYNFDHYNERHIDPSVIHDSEPVRIYIDYGYCFMWDGTASKSKLYITSPLSENSYNEDVINESRTIDLWVYEYFINHGYGTMQIEENIRDRLFKIPRYKVGDYVYFVATVDEILWHPGMFKTGSPEKPISKKIIHIDYTNNGIMYQVKGCHFDENMIGIVVFDTYEDAVDGLNRRHEEGSEWKRLRNRKIDAFDRDKQEEIKQWI